MRFKNKRIQKAQIMMCYKVQV